MVSMRDYGEIGFLSVDLDNADVLCTISMINALVMMRAYPSRTGDCNVCILNPRDT
jgi:hypothetical protein